MRFLAIQPFGPTMVATVVDFKDRGHGHHGHDRHCSGGRHGQTRQDRQDGQI